MRLFILYRYYTFFVEKKQVDTITYNGTHEQWEDKNYRITYRKLNCIG